MIEVTVYGKKLCVKCDRTKAQMDKLGISYNYIDVEENPDEAAVVRFLGYTSLPVVSVGDIDWNDYRHTKINRLAELLKSEEYYRMQSEYEAVELRALEYLREGLLM